jgi:hypothetical protein
LNTSAWDDDPAVEAPAVSEVIGLVRRRAAEALLSQGIADLDFDGNPEPMPPL